MAAWSCGMILASGARGPGLNSRSRPFTDPCEEKTNSAFVAQAHSCSALLGSEQIEPGEVETRQARMGSKSKKWKEADSTLRSSQAVPHPSTNRALCCLTSEVERDPVHSTRYGRRRRAGFVDASKKTLPGLEPATKSSRIAREARSARPIRPEPRICLEPKWLRSKL